MFRSASPLRLRTRTEFFFVACVSASFLLAGCAGEIRSEKTITGPAGSAEGQWRGRAHVVNTKTKKTATLDLDIIAKEPSSLRIEATSSFGIPAASVAMGGGQIKILLPQEKKFIVAPADRDALARLIPVKITPDCFLALLFDRPLKCASDGGVTVKREESKDSARFFELSGGDAQVLLKLTEAKAKVQATSGLFDLEAPPNYKQEIHQQQTKP